MRNTLVILAVAATTAYAQMDNRPPMNPDVLDQRWGCYWQCQTVNDRYYNGEVCYDTCTPKLSRYVNDNEQDIGFIYNIYVWDRGYNRQVFDYASDNDEARVFNYFNDFHAGKLEVQSGCWPFWTCDWEQCEENEDGDECWKENCYEDCGNEEDICKIWYAVEYDYSYDTWRWEIEDCNKGLADEASAFVEKNFGASLDMAKESTCPYGDCVDTTAMMAAEAVADVTEGEIAEIPAERVADSLGDALDSFYMNDGAVQFANTVAEEAGNAFDIDTDALNKAINAESSDNLAQGVGEAVSEETEDAQWADWISTFVSGLMNRADERKGERDYSDYYYDDYYYEDGDW